MDACKKKISDYDIKLSTTAKDLSAKEKISKRNKQNDNGKQDKYINDIAQNEIPGTFYFELMNQ